MIFVIPSSFLLCLPILAVFLIACAIAIYSYKDIGGDAGMIHGLMCIFAPIFATIMFAFPYGLGLILYFMVKG